MAREDIIANLVVTGLSAFTGGMAGARRSVEGLEGASGKMAGTVGKSGGILAGIGSAAATAGKVVAGFGTSAAVFAGNMGWQFNQQLDTARLRFGLFTKSARETNQVIEAVNETASKSTFSRPELSQVAAQLGFAGVRAKEMQTNVTGIANAVAAVGGGAADLNNITDIMSRLARGGKATGNEIYRLANQGLPVYDILGKKLNLTAEQVAGIGKQGIEGRKVYDALMETFTSGNMAAAAKKQAESTAGRWHNIMGRIRRETGQLMRPLYDFLGTTLFPFIQKQIIPQVFQGIKTAVGAITSGVQEAWTVVQPVLSALGAGFGGGDTSQFTGIASVFADVGSSIKDAKNEVVGFFDAITAGMAGNVTPAKEGLAGFGTDIGAVFSDAWSDISAFFSQLGQFIGPAVDYFKDQFDTFKTVAVGAFDAISAVARTWLPIFRPIWNAFGDVFIGVVKAILPILGPLLKTMGGFIARLLGVAARIINAFAPLAKAVLPILKGFFWLIKTVGLPVLKLLGGILMTVLPIALNIVIGALNVAVDVFESVIGTVADVVNFFINNFIPVLTTVADVVGRVVVDAINGLIDAANWLWNHILKPLAGFLALVLLPVWWPIREAIIGVINGVNWLGDRFGWVWNNVLKPVVSWLGGAFRSAWSGARDAMNWVVTAINTISDKFSWVLNNVLKPVASWLTGAFKDAWSGLKSVMDPIASVLNSIADAIKKIKDLGSGIWDKLTDLATGGGGGGLLGLGVGPLGTGGIIGAQTGAVTGTGSRFLVGERGPELISLPAGSRINPLPPPSLTPAQMGGGGGQIVVPVYLDRRQIAEAIGSFTADQAAAR